MHNLAPVDEALDVPTMALADEVTIASSQPSPATDLWVDPNAPGGATIEYVLKAEMYGRNRVINGDFSVNQRGFTNAPLSGWSFDRWFTSSGGGTVTYSAGAPALGELPESARSYMRIVVSGQGSGHWALISQPIESVRTLSGKTVTVSFWARAASGTPKIGVKFEQKFGASGSAQVNTFPGSVTINTTWTRYAITGTVPSVASTTIGTDGKDALGVCLIVSEGTGGTGIGAQANTFDIWGVQVEEGTGATAYEQKSYADELRACQRYFVRLDFPSASDPLGMGVAYQATNIYGITPLPQMVRRSPTVTFSGAWQALLGGAAINGSSIVHTGSTANHAISWNLTVAGATVGHSALVRAQAAGAYMTVDAEL